MKINYPYMVLFSLFFTDECFILTKSLAYINFSQNQKKLLQINNIYKAKSKFIGISLKPKTLIAFTSPEKIKVTIQSY